MDKEKVIKKLLAKRLVDPETGCWLWTGCKNSTNSHENYGRIMIKRQQFLVHRLAFLLWKGVRPKSGLVVCHYCDTPTCFNPDHLFTGTQADNARDMHQKGRARCNYGEAHHNTRLSEEDIREIFILREQGFSYQQIADKFNTWKGSIHRIVKGKTWKAFPRGGFNG